MTAGGASDSNPTGSGSSLTDLLQLPANSSITYTVTGTVLATATGTLSNTATADHHQRSRLSTQATDNDNITTNNANLSGFVYVDVNNNGVKDAGEPPIAGVVVVLTGTASGGGAVNLQTHRPIRSVLQLQQLGSGQLHDHRDPADQLHRRQGRGRQPEQRHDRPDRDHQSIQNITLTAGTDGINNNFGNLGLTPPYVSKRQFMYPNTPPLDLTHVDTLSGYVYSEATPGGRTSIPRIPPRGEAALSGVTVTLTGTGGTQTTTTTATGAYSFGKLQPGTYTLTVTTPSGLRPKRHSSAARAPAPPAWHDQQHQDDATAWGTDNDFPNLVQTRRSRSSRSTMPAVPAAPRRPAT